MTGTLSQRSDGRNRVLLRGLGLCVVLAGGAVALAACFAGGVFGPPRVVLAEAYANEPGGATFDHSAFDRLVRRLVNEEGCIDYQGLSKDTEDLDGYIAALGGASFEELGRNDKLALLINAYNAFTLRMILDFQPVKSIRDIPEHQRWDHQRWPIGDLTLSLNQIEHERIRPKFKEPRIHFALVCAAVGCPPLRNEAYTADKLERQLDEQARTVHRVGGRWLRFDAQRNIIQLTRLYKWYGGDFTQAAGSVLDYAARYVPQLESALSSGRKPKIEWLDYDWTLNSKANAR